jgi:23S rRNA pseudouridine2604 synthase
MSDRPTLKLKPGAAARDPQRLRVRATTAPRQSAADTKPAAAAPEPRRSRPPPKRSDTRPERAPRPSAPIGPRPAPPPPRRALPAAAPVPLSAAAAKAPRPTPAARAEGIRLSKALTEQGIASRREADDWIAAGWVRVDGEMAVLGQRVLPHQRIDIDPAARTQQARSVTILLNKPVGHVSGQAEDGYPPAAALITPANRWAEEKRPFHPGHARGLAPAGRLDIDSTGLLVLTQDGRIAKLLIGENSLVEKEYLVRVAHAFAEGVPDHVLQLLRHGLELDGEALKPAKVSWANEDQLRIVLQQGKKRQIRRMCEAVGLQVTGLKRVRIGSVVLGKLPAGQWRYLRDDERF